ncbi:calcium binding EGF domain protein [Ancylostoma duodenale]|uniref:Calcium binding EGF domain protein n=1 Tax=Ancylostoma duodenale TaxID=51022 RepID=A0A0C2GYZ4_9BILA|nr:calcium binding EGF domain protein [Ancylostoma duodenale]
MRLLTVYGLFIVAAAAKKNRKEDDRCRYCHFLVATFEAGLRRTARHHFAGGDTAWEEKKLGKYATSETRFIETMEGICKKNTIIEMDLFHGLQELEFRCNTLVEEHEDLLEEYYYKHQATNMTEWLCEERIKLCCPDGHYGKDCLKCPGFEITGTVCFGHGSCDGNGRRYGTGKCTCDTGYVGNLCRQCAADHFEKSKTENSIECEKCFEGCAGGCSASGPKGCTKCKNGWNETSDGCVDIDECALETTCSNAHEKCVNLQGSYRCDCVDGYKRDGSACVLDVEAKPYRMLIPPDTLLKGISMTSLALIIAFVIWRRSIFLLVLTAIAVALIIFIDMNVNPDTIPDSAKKYLGL